MSKRKTTFPSAKRKPKVKKETAYTYTNKFTGKRITFKPSISEVMVKFQPGVAEKDVSKMMSETSSAISQGYDVYRGFAVFQIGPEADMESTVTAMETHRQVANSIPVMIDDEGATRYFLPDEFAVQFEEGVTKENAKAIIKDQGCEILVEQRTSGYYTVSVPKGKGLFEMLRAFSRLDEVAFAEPSEVGFYDELVYLPDDPDFSRLWGLHNTGQTGGSANADIDAPEAWDISRGTPNIIIAVIDTGADLSHPDLLDNILDRGEEDWNFGEPANPVPDDCSGHGTHVSGTVASVDNDRGVIGVAPGCQIMPLRVNLTSGMNQNRADAINYVAAEAAAHPERRYIINCSWKMSGDHAGVHNAIQNAVNHNVVVVFAAGNANRDIDTNPQYPAVYPEVIAVAATDDQDEKASFSNYGTKVDVAAPGVSIYSTYPGTYTHLSGTSMAAPHVAGLAALIWSLNPALTNEKIRQIIETSTDNIDGTNPGYVGKLGSGRINAWRALLSTPLPPITFQVSRKFPFPQNNNGSSTGLSYARCMRIGFERRSSVLLFLTQKPYSERIYYMSAWSGEILGSVDPTNNNTIGSLTWDGRNIRVANVTTGAGFINTINPSTGAQIGSMGVPPGRGEGLTYDETYLYYSTIQRIHVINPATGAVVRSHPPPSGRPSRALTYGNGYIFSGDSQGGIITVYDRNTLRVRGTVIAPGGGSAKVEGLAFNPFTNELFIANQSENTVYVGQVTL